MNLVLLGTGILTLIAFLVHMLAGDRELRALKPGGPPAIGATWVQTRCGWHWVSLDLLGASVLLLLIALTDVITHPDPLLTILVIYFAANGMVWIVTIALSDGGAWRRLATLPQWVFCFVVAALIFAGAS